MNIIEEIASVMEKEGINTPDSKLLAEKIHGILMLSYQEGFQVATVSRAKKRYGIRKLLVEYKVKNISRVLDEIENLDS